MGMPAGYMVLDDPRRVQVNQETEELHAEEGCCFARLGFREQKTPSLITQE
jgi:hypothetical protein